MATTSTLALIVALNYAGTECELGGCLNDADNVRSMLVSQLGVSQSDITVLLERQATRRNIVVAIQQLVSRTNSLAHANPRGQINLVFHYSGHGSQTLSLTPGERDRKDETIVPIDYETQGQITDDDLAFEFSQLSNNAHLFANFDCCHSGSILDLPYVVSPNGSGQFTPTQPDRPLNLSRWGRGANIVCLSGCRDTQTSADFNGAGAMTTAFLEVLRKNRYSITVKSLLEQMRVHLKARGFSQFAQLSTSQPISSDTMFIGKRGRERGLLMSRSI